MNLNSRSLILAAAIAGVAIGVLSNVPLVACLNCLLLAWVWLGGIAAVYLYRGYEKQPYLTVTQGLILGALAGAIGALVGGVVSLIFGGLSTALTNTVSQLAGENGVTVPNFVLSSGFSILSTILNVFLYAVVGAVGGLIATGLIWKAPAGQIPPYTPPPSGPMV